MIGGAIEAVVGAGLVAAGVGTSEIGVGIPLAAAGAFVTMHGADVAVSGFRSMWHGKQVDTSMSQELQSRGMTRPEANRTDAGISIVGSLGAGVATAAIKVSAIRATEPLAQGLSTTKILSQIESGSKALNNADYLALGAGTTSPMAKAVMLETGVNAAGESYQLTTTALQSFGKSIQLIPTGPTPLGDIGLGVLGAAGGVANAVQSQTDRMPFSTSQVPTPTPGPPPPPRPNLKD